VRLRVKRVCKSPRGHVEIAFTESSRNPPACLCSKAEDSPARYACISRKKEVQRFHLRASWFSRSLFLSISFSHYVSLYRLMSLSRSRAQVRRTAREMKAERTFKLPEETRCLPHITSRKSRESDYAKKSVTRFYDTFRSESICERRTRSRFLSLALCKQVSGLPSIADKVNKITIWRKSLLYPTATFCGDQLWRYHATDIISFYGLTLRRTGDHDIYLLVHFLSPDMRCTLLS